MNVKMRDESDFAEEVERVMSKVDKTIRWD
jgi:hypothetical protein